MENISQDDEFHPSLEPDVIIDDQIECNGNFGEKDDLFSDDSVTETNSGDQRSPEVSIIPIKRTPIKIKMFTKSINSHFLDNFKCNIQNVVNRSSRESVRLVSKEEIQKAELSSSTKRKSLPLEKCPICKKYFRRMKTHLQKHENVKRNPNDPLTCQFCMKSFNTGSNLSIHMRTHTGDKPYICEVCLKGFAQSCNLVNHMRIHTGERPFKCPHCDRAFTQSGNLTNHIRLHTDDKPFKCHFCDKAFTQSGNLNSHIRNNHKFTEELNKSFSIENVQ